MSGRAELATISGLITYRRYIVANALNEVRTRYAGTSLGIAWHIMYPLTIVFVLGAVLSGAFPTTNSRLGGVGASLSIACGLLPWLALSDALSRGTNSLVEHSLYLRKLSIPEEVYIAKSILASSIYCATLLLFLCVLVALSGHFHPIQLVLLPVVAILLLMLAFGLSLALSPLNVLMRDVGQTLPLLLQLGMWLSPVLYPAELMPYGLAALQAVNPFSPFLAAIRSLMLDGMAPGIWTWFAMIGWAAGSCIIGAGILQKVRAELRDNL